jgi:hypothetical protein
MQLRGGAMKTNTISVVIFAMIATLVVSAEIHADDKPAKQKISPEAWVICITDMISEQWVPAYDPSENKIKNLYMNFRVDDKGYIIYSKLAYTTGDVSLDKALEESFKKIVKLPAPPFELVGNKGYYDMIFSKGESVQQSGNGFINKKEDSMNYNRFSYSSSGNTPFYYRTDRSMMSMVLIKPSDGTNTRDLKKSELDMWSVAILDKIDKSLEQIKHEGTAKKASVAYEIAVSGYGVISSSKMIKASDIPDIDITVDSILKTGAKLNAPPVPGKYYLMFETRLRK